MRHLRAFIPKSLLRGYHYLLAFAGALLYRFPSRELTVIGITGTKGKTTTAELLTSILERAGYKTALAGTLRFKIADESRPNRHKMTMPGRFFLAQFLRQAVSAGCDYAVVEMTSEGAAQYRHTFIDLDALIFLNLAPEHIESHGSYEAYVKAKLSIAERLATSIKPRKVLIANAEDAETPHFLALAETPNAPSRFETCTFSPEEARPYTADEKGNRFTFRQTLIISPLPGKFNLYNLLAAATAAEAIGIHVEDIKAGLEACRGVPGRAERIEAGQDFRAIIDYAHTPDSLEAIYGAFDAPKICVLGSTGGGRDTWKRPVMGGIADTQCKHIILTNEDPYDEDPEKIVREIAAGISRTPYETIMSRREAIARAVSLASTGDVVIITGKGTDPYIMGPVGTKEPWSDAEVTREELAKLSTKADLKKNKSGK
jgi:UDP-N-acetylmuramoyl-L-alanyl-D-glutamate--2,6-diaminopimelate ligase